MFGGDKIFKEYRQKNLTSLTATGRDLAASFRHIINEKTLHNFIPEEVFSIIAACVPSGHKEVWRAQFSRILGFDLSKFEGSIWVFFQ